MKSVGQLAEKFDLDTEELVENVFDLTFAAE